MNRFAIQIVWLALLSQERLRLWDLRWQVIHLFISKPR
jgi:hypothetical protein